jgi:hypothetical protein
MNGPNTFMAGLQHGWTVFMGFVPRFFLALVILVVGYFLAKLVARGVDLVLERVGFNRLVERGGIKRALERTSFDASDIISKIVLYTLMLFVLELAFSSFGPNPISLILTGIIAFLPNIFVALVIVLVSAAIAAAIKELLVVALGTLSYGRLLANLASGAVLVLGVFAALDQLKIAPAIVHALFYATLAALVGSAIVAIGGGGILPMRARWEKAMAKLERELPRAKAEAERATGRVETAAQSWKEEAQHEVHAVAEVHEEEHPHPETPRF